MALATGTAVNVTTLVGVERGRIYDTHTDGTDRWYRIHFDDDTFLTLPSSLVAVRSEQ